MEERETREGMEGRKGNTEEGETRKGMEGIMTNTEEEKNKGRNEEVHTYLLTFSELNDNMFFFITNHHVFRV